MAAAPTAASSKSQHRVSLSASRLKDLPEIFMNDKQLAHLNKKELPYRGIVLVEAIGRL